MAKIINYKKCFQRPITAKLSQWFITSCGGGGGGGGGGMVVGFWGDHISHGFQGERGGAVVSNKVYRGDYWKFTANKEGGGGGHKNITEP